MPSYNSEKFIRDTIDSVIAQTYLNWELLVVDDCSTDSTVEIVNEYAAKDSRVKVCVLETNQGAAVARNKALELSSGRFIAYLDSDDLWKNNKLEIQVDFMIKNNIAFSCTDYDKIEENGESLNKIIELPNKIDYALFLRNTIIQTVGVLVDTEHVSRDVLVMPNIRRRQDAATWCQILKAGFDCYRVPFCLATYRVVSNSLSSNKWKAIQGTWYLYREIEKLNFFYAVYCFIGYAFNAVKKRIYNKKK